MSEESDIVEAELSDNHIVPLEVKVVNQPKPEKKEEEIDKEYYTDIEMSEEELKNEEETEDW